MSPTKKYLLVGILLVLIVSLVYVTTHHKRSDEPHVPLQIYVPPPGNADAAEAVLISYLNALAAQDFATAAKSYSGDMDVLRQRSPDVDVYDIAGLLTATCEGDAWCGSVSSIERIEHNAEKTQFTYTVRYIGSEQAFTYGVLHNENGYSVLTNPPIGD